LNRPDGQTGERPKRSFLKKQAPSIVKIQVGLDFGTSATKAVYKKFGGRYSRPILWDHGLSEYPEFVIPSLAVVSDEGRLVFGAEAARILEDRPFSDGLRNIKVVLAGKYNDSHHDPVWHKRFHVNIADLKSLDHDSAAEYITTLYLAFVMHQTRLKLEALPGYISTRLDLYYNICVPIDYIEIDGLWSVFGKIVACAELCAGNWKKLQEGNFEYGIWKRYWNSADYGHAGQKSFLRSDPSARSYLVPESVAQTASYITSLEREEGIFALIDFGAGTTDVSIFKVFLGDKQDWFAARNLPIGCRQLEEVLVEVVGTSEYGHRTTRKMVIDALDDASNRDRDTTSGNGAVDEVIQEHLDDVYQRAKSVWGEAAQHEKRESSWRVVSIFKMGGGAELPGIGATFGVPVPYRLGRRSIHYLTRDIPQPSDFIGGPETPFERLAVAYGLSLPAPQLADYRLPAETPDHTPIEDEPSEYGDFDGGHCPNPKSNWLR